MVEIVERFGQPMTTSVFPNSVSSFRLKPSKSLRLWAGAVSSLSGEYWPPQRGGRKPRRGRNPETGDRIPPKSAEYDERSTLREELEALAVRLATPRLTLAVISKARNLLAEAWRAIERDDRVQLAERNTEFHMIFCAHSGNGHLHRILSNLQDKVTLSSILGWRAHATMTIEHEQHTRILDAAEARDADLAAQRMRDHVHEFRVHYRKGENDIATAQR